MEKVQKDQMKNRDIKKFAELHLNEEFSMPDFIYGFERQFLKVTEHSYADLITKQMFWCDGNMNVERKIESHETNKQKESK